MLFCLVGWLVQNIINSFHNTANDILSVHTHLSRLDCIGVYVDTNSLLRIIIITSAAQRF